MRDVIGVRFRTNGKIYYFDPKEYNVPEGCYVIVETARGVEYGHVVTGRKSVDEKSIPQDLKPIIRLATEEDSRQFEANKEKSKKAYDICLEKIKEHELEMKLIAAEYRVFLIYIAPCNSLSNKINTGYSSRMRQYRYGSLPSVAVSQYFQRK